MMNGAALDSIYQAVPAVIDLSSLGSAHVFQAGGGNAVTIQTALATGTSWGSGVLTVERSNDGANWFALATATTISSSTITTVTPDTNFLRVVVSTAGSAGVTVKVAPYVSAGLPATGEAGADGAFGGFPAYVVGNYYDQAINGIGNAVLASAANRVELYPFRPAFDFKIDRIGLFATTGIAASNAKCLIYASGSDNWPDALILETGDISTATSSTFTEATVDHTFSKGVLYWIGRRTSANPSLRATSFTGCMPLGKTSTTSTTYLTMIRRTVTYATAAPDPWVFDSADLTNGSCTSMNMRAAAI
jgi:hypothetical protein